MSDAPRRVAVYASSFDPPGVNQRTIAQRLAERFDEVIVFPYGPRSDRPSDDSLLIHRAVMADLNFRGLDRVRVELSDLERGSFTPPCDYPRLFGAPGVQIVHTVNADHCRGGQAGQSLIQRDWTRGRELWETSDFVILHEPHEPLEPEDFPPHANLLEVPLTTSSYAIRSMLFDGTAHLDGWLCPDVGRYIHRHGLFRATPPARECIVTMPEPRVLLYYDPRNTESVRIAEQLRRWEHPDPNIVIVIGGDGTMLRAIRQHWRARIPFYGLNTGHLGFLLNDKSRTDFAEHDLRLYQLPLLWVEMIGPDGERRGELCFNDCWIERETGQTAWVEIRVNGYVRMRKVVADGMLVATAAGSTSYARAMGATPVPFNASLLTLVGSNVLTPEFWHPAILTTDSVVSIRNLDPNKRPLRGFIDGVPQGQVVELTTRVSNIAAVELLFTREHDPVAKLALLQFPQIEE